MCINCFSQTEYPKLTEIVTDDANVFSETELLFMRNKLSAFEEETTNQIVVLTINDLKGETIESYAYEVFNKNELGREDVDNGVLILFSKNDREVRIEVGMGLESYITDALASRVIRNTMVPRFKEEKYFKGIDVATDQIIDFLKDPKAIEEFNEADDTNENKNDWIFKLIFTLFILIFVIAGLFLFMKGYKALIEIFRGVFIGKLSVLRAILLLGSIVFSIMFSLIFVLGPSMGILALNGFDLNKLVFLIEGPEWSIILSVLLFVTAILIAILKVVLYENGQFKLSFCKSDKRYYSKTFSSKGKYSFVTSSSSSSSSTSSSSSSSSGFSGGGGSSGGGGASGSW